MTVPPAPTEAPARPPRVVALVQARMKSARSPGKVLADVNGFSMLWHVMHRTQTAPGVDVTVLCTSDGRADDPLENLAKRHRWPFHRGPEDDVLTRMCQAATMMQADFVVRITADCPLMDPSVISMTIRRHLAGIPLPTLAFPALTTTSPDTTTGWMDGLDVEVFGMDALSRASQTAFDSYEREHVTPWLRKHEPIGYISWEDCYPERAKRGIRLKWSVDTKEDLAFVRAVHEKLGRGLWGVPAVLDCARQWRAV